MNNLLKLFVMETHSIMRECTYPTCEELSKMKIEFAIIFNCVGFGMAILLIGMYCSESEKLLWLQVSNCANFSPYIFLFLDLTISPIYVFICGKEMLSA